MKKPYEVYADTECPRCGNTGNNIDHGPYKPHPLDEALGGTPDPSVHLMTCGGCHKVFDVAPQELVEAAMPELAAHFPDACPALGCCFGNAPVRVYEKRGRHLAEYRCPRGHMWVTRWGHNYSTEPVQWWPIERQIVDVFPSEHDTALPVDALEALVNGTGE